MFKKKALYILLCILVLEAILQLAGLFFTLKIKPNLYKKDDFVILCFGDSHTFGMGAPPKESYPSQLEQLLNKRTTLRNHIRVINLGVPGYNSSQCLAKLKSTIDVYKPKIIIAMVGRNNCWNFMESNYFKINQFKYNYPILFKLRLLNAWLCKSKIYKFIKISVMNIKQGMYLSTIAKYHDSDISREHYSFHTRSPESAELFKQGEEYYESGDYSSAENCYLKLLKLNPDDYEPHFYMARLQLFKGNVGKAKEEALIALHYAPWPSLVVYILVDMESSESFKEFFSIVKSLRSEWVARFGEDTVARLIDPMVSPSVDGIAKTLVYDCTEMKMLADKNNATLVLMTYPYLAPDKSMLPPNIYTRIAKYLDIPLIDNKTFFNRHLKDYRKEEIFTIDGHCNSKGYFFMA